MISIFNGTRRSLGESSRKDIYAQIDVGFRKYIKYFKGAKLPVFIAISLHINEEGVCNPSYDLLMEETGLGRDTIAQALNDLCELTIEENRVLTKWRTRNNKGQLVGSNNYKIFPTEEDCQSWENPTLDKSLLEVKPSFKEKPKSKNITDEGANAAPPPAAVQSSVLPIEKAQPDTITANAVTTSPPIAPPPPTGKRKKSDGATTPKEPKPESVDMYQRWVRREYNPPTFCTSSQVELITNTVTDLPRWERTLSYWAKNAYRPNRVEDLLDAYSKDSGVIDQTRRDNFTRAAPKPQPGTEYDKAQKQPRLSQEEIQRRIQMAEEAERNLQ